MSDISSKVEIKYLNFYRCPCGAEWQDEWDSTCNDRCPKCNKEIEPYKSEDIVPPSPMPEEVKDAVDTIFNWLNKMGLEKEVTKVIIDAVQVQHRTLKQNFMRCVIVPIINEWAYNHEVGAYDLRNEETVKACTELKKILKTKHFPFI